MSELELFGSTPEDTAHLNLEVDQLYPYDERLDVHDLTDARKLHAIADRRTAQLLLELWRHVEANERDPKFLARERARAKRHEAAELERLKQLAEEARIGVFGVAGKEIWNTVTEQGKDMRKEALEEVAKALRGKPRVK